MTEPPPGELVVLRDVSRRLEEAAIPYMLTGSLAMSFYTTPRMTRDIDVVEAVRDRSSFNLIEQSSITKVDVFPRKRDQFRDTEFARRRRVTISGFDTWLVTAEDLVLAKLLWTRDSRSEVQMRDVRALLHTDLDREYIERWVRELGLADLWREVQP